MAHVLEWMVKFSRELVGGCQDVMGGHLWWQQGGGGVKRPLCTTRANVCWQFNDGWCRFGSSCKFPYKCEVCGGRHGRLKCGKNKA